MSLELIDVRRLWPGFVELVSGLPADAQTNYLTPMKPQFRDVRDRLRFVGVKRDDYDLSQFPDFLIIGPQRTGTTWLHSNLVLHPEVHIPWHKELHYFNNLEYPEYHPKHLPPVDKDLGWYLDRFVIGPGERKDRASEARELFGCSFNPRAYGEATATYAAAVHEGIIEDILTLNPDIKIITMVRNPIDRAWSHAKKDLCKERKRAVADVPESEWLEFFHNSYQVACGNYSKFLPLWKKLIPQDNFMMGRFVDVSGDPLNLLTRVYNLLGIDADPRFLPESAAERVNPTEGAGIPANLRVVLEKIFGDEVASLRDQGLI